MRRAVNPQNWGQSPSLLQRALGDFGRPVSALRLARQSQRVAADFWYPSMRLPPAGSAWRVGLTARVFEFKHCRTTRPRRKRIREVILTFAKVHDTAGTASSRSSD